MNFSSGMPNFPLFCQRGFCIQTSDDSKHIIFCACSLVESNFSRIKITMIMSMMRKTNERASAKSENLLAIARFEQKINLLHRLFTSFYTEKLENILQTWRFLIFDGPFVGLSAKKIN